MIERTVFARCDIPNCPGSRKLDPNDPQPFVTLASMGWRLEQYPDQHQQILTICTLPHGAP